MGVSSSSRKREGKSRFYGCSFSTPGRLLQKQIDKRDRWVLAPTWWQAFNLSCIPTAGEQGAAGSLGATGLQMEFLRQGEECPIWLLGFLNKEHNLRDWRGCLILMVELYPPSLSCLLYYSSNDLCLGKTIRFLPSPVAFEAPEFKVSPLAILRFGDKNMNRGLSRCGISQESQLFNRRCFSPQPGVSCEGNRGVKGASPFSLHR